MGISKRESFSLVAASVASSASGASPAFDASPSLSPFALFLTVLASSDVLATHVCNPAAAAVLEMT